MSLESFNYWNFSVVRNPQFYPGSPNLLVKLFSAMCRGIVLWICSNLIKMGSLELDLSRVPMSADFIDPLYTESSHSANCVLSQASHIESIKPKSSQIKPNRGLRKP